MKIISCLKLQDKLFTYKFVSCLIFLWNIFVAEVSGGAVVKNPPASTGHIRDTDSIPRSWKSLRVENANPLQCSCLQNSLDRGAKLQSMGLQRVGHDWAHTYTHSLFFIDDHGTLFYLVSSSSGLVEDFLLIVFLIFLYSCYNFILYFLMWDWSVALVLIEV